jgi:hypothetical protein
MAQRGMGMAWQWRIQEFFSWRGVQQIQLRTEGREKGDLGALAPYSGVLLNLQMSEPRILIRLLGMYFPLNREFGSALSKLRNFGWGGLNPPRNGMGAAWARHEKFELAFRLTTLGRSFLKEGTARRRQIYPTAHNTQHSMPENANKLEATGICKYEE